jgi:glycosyltransferase involved in cell wall biosynthesis
VKRPIPSLAFIVPCFNEEEVLASTASRLLNQLQAMAEADLCDHAKSGILFIDDGSKDATWSLIESLSATNDAISGLLLSRNKGHKSALVAGLVAVSTSADVSISVDADLQDDINVCSHMLESYLAGSDIVYGVRLERSTDTRSKRFFANLFYSLMQLMGAEIVPGHADFRMISRPVLAELLRYQERSLFLRGIIPQLGYRTAIVYYARQARNAGISKYPFRKSLSLAIDGIFSLSNRPLRLITYMGLILAGSSVVGVLWTIATFVMGGTIPGWASMIVIIAVLGGAQLLSLGILGEYLGRIYKEVKRRPLYHIQDNVGKSKWS